VRIECIFTTKTASSFPQYPTYGVKKQKKGRVDQTVSLISGTMAGGYRGDQGMVLMVTRYISCGQQLFTIFFMLAHKYFYGLIHNGSILIGHRSKSYG
jgi:hypothetical protein